MCPIREATPAVALVAALAMSATPALAQVTVAAPATRAASLKDLLEHVESAQNDEQRAFEARVAEFEATPAEQESMLEQAEARRDELEESSMALSDTYSENEIRINELNGELLEKARALGLAELFGVARETAGTAAVVMRQSLITTQFPAAAGEATRDELLRDFGAGRTVPTPDQLEHLWFEIYREITASGQIARYRAPVVQLSGETVDSEVVRIGTFNATSNGQFLTYLPELQTLSMLPRQLPDEFLSVAGRFEQTPAGYAEAVVDATRGVLLGLYVERPTFMERIQLGEAVGYVIIAVGLLGAIAFLFQLVKLTAVRIAVTRQLRDLDRPTTDNPLGRVLLAFKGDPHRIEQDADIAELRISEAVLREVPKLERFQAFLRLAVAAGPLLGLIGTVVGMIITFQSITESGSSDPKLMASGIGQAMIATVLGLGIAIPLLFANALLSSLSRTVVQILDEQSAGMLAESIERQRGLRDA